MISVALDSLVLEPAGAWAPESWELVAGLQRVLGSRETVPLGWEDCLVDLDTVLFA